VYFVPVPTVKRMERMGVATVVVVTVGVVTGGVVTVDGDT